MSVEQRRKLSEAQKRYIATDPRWQAHRAKLAERMQEYTDSEYFEAQCENASRKQRFKLFDEEASAARAMLSRGRNFEYVSETLCLSPEVLRRELKVLGISTAPAKPEKRAKRGKGFWRSFEEA